MGILGFIGMSVRRHAFSLAGQMLAAGFIVYFAYYALEGDRGLYKLASLQHKTSEAEQTLKALQKKHQMLKAKAEHLSAAHLDLDLLDEEVRRLGWTTPGDIIVPQEISPGSLPDTLSARPRR